MCQAILGVVALIAAVVFNTQPIADLIGEDGAKIMQSVASSAGLSSQLGAAGVAGGGGAAGGVDLSGSPLKHSDSASSSSSQKKHKKKHKKKKRKHGGSGGGSHEEEHEEEEVGGEEEASSEEEGGDDGWQTSVGGKHGGAQAGSGKSDNHVGQSAAQGEADKRQQDPKKQQQPDTKDDKHAAYYSSVNLYARGPELRSQLKRLVGRHAVLEYHMVWDALESVDASTLGGKGCQGKSQVQDMYSGMCWSKKRGRCGKNDLDVSKEGSCYNREHSWPKSWWGGDWDSAAATDLQHLFLTDAYVNKLRSNLPLGNVDKAEFTSSNGAKIGVCAGGRRLKAGGGRSQGKVKFFNDEKGFGFIEREGSGGGDVFLHQDHVKGGERVFAGDLVQFKVVKGGKGDAAREAERVGRCFEPPAGIKGDLARVYFYMSVAYEGDFSCCSSFPGVERNRINEGMEGVLRTWHREDPVQESERKRNDEIFRLQGNRNPFVDHPHLVQSITDF